MKVLKALTAHFQKLPGVGPKSALRLAHHVLFSMKRVDVEGFGAALQSAHGELRLCEECFAIADDRTCFICSSAQRDGSRIMVVADIRDLLAVEETGAFRGRYHVLGGLISPINRVDPEHLKIRELVKRVAGGAIQEVILGMVPTAEGEVTAHYILNMLKPFPVTVSHFGAGIPVGGSIEYMDSMTVTQAILNRRPLNAAPAAL